MSLAPAPKDTTTNPSKTAVIDPVDKDAKAKDVDRKLTFYTTLLALRQSKLPSNAQLNKYLTHWKHLQQPASDPAKSSLSKDGQKLVRDVQDILETLKVMVNEKNQDELIQDFVWGIKAFGDDQLPTQLPDTGDVTKDKAKEDAQTAGTHLRTLLTLLVTNSEARKLLSDFGLVGRDLLSKGLVKAAEGVAPPEEKLQSVNEEHKGDSFISKEQQEKEKAQLRDLKAKANEKKEQANEKKEQAKEKKEQVKDEAADRAETAREEGVGAATESPPTSPPKKKGLMERMVGGVKDSIPGEHQEKAKAQYSRGKEFLTEEYFPEDRRDQWIWRAKKIILECQKHPEYQESLEWLIAFVKEYASHGRNISSQHVKSQQDQIPSSLNTSLTQLKTILERFASGQSFDLLILDPVNALIDDASRDQELREWWIDVGEWLERCVKEPGYILDENSNERGRELEQRGRVFFGTERPSKDGELGGMGSSATPTVGIPGTTASTTAQHPSHPPTGMADVPGPTQLDVSIQPYRVDGDALGRDNSGVAKAGEAKRVSEGKERGKYRGHLDRLLDGARDFVKALGDDPVNKRLGKDVSRLTKDLLFEGDQLAFKKELWNDVRSVILPAFIEKVGYIPIPRIEYTDETFDLVVENLTLSGRNLFPNVVEVEIRNWMRWETFAKKGEKDKDHPNSNHTFHLHLTQIQADMRDVLFYFHKKGGAIKMQDSGVADLVLGGEGMSVDVHLSSSRDPGSLFDIDKTHVKIDGSLKVSIRDSKHDVLYKTLKPLMMGLVKRQVQKAVEGGLRSGFEWLSEELMAVKQRMDEARSNVADGDEEKEIGRIKALHEAFKRSPSTSSSSHSHSNSQFKVVANKRNSILGDVGHSGGWVQRVQEREKVIPKADGQVKGDGTWKSDVFDLSTHE